MFHKHVDKSRDVRFVVDVLDMFSFIESSMASLSPAERASLESDVGGPLGMAARFTGFDGNNEADYRSIADFLVNTMGRFTEFADRDLNSHRLGGAEGYRSMLRVFEPMRARLDGTGLSGPQLVQIFKAFRER